MKIQRAGAEFPAHNSMRLTGRFSMQINRLVNGEERLADNSQPVAEMLAEFLGRTDRQYYLHPRESHYLFSTTTGHAT